MHKLDATINRPACLYMYYIKILRADQVNEAYSVYDVD